MRTNTELSLIGLAAVQLAFFSWPVPKIVKDIFHTGIGRLAGILGVAQLAKQQSAALAIIAAIFQVKSTQAAQHENFVEGLSIEQSHPNATEAQMNAYKAATNRGKTHAEALAAAGLSAPQTPPGVAAMQRV